MPTTTAHTAAAEAAARTARGTKVMYVGLATTVLVMLVPLVDLLTADTLFDHVRDAYPQWDASTVQKDRNAIVIYLTVVGVLGILTWLWTIWAVRARKRWARAAVAAAFGVGAAVSLMNATLGGDAYDTILPPAYGLVGLLPAVAGAVAVASAWRRRD